MEASALLVDELHSDAGPQSPLVVLVHGSMDRHTSFARIRNRLVESCHVVSYDRRGYAGSRAVSPPARGLEDHLADLAKVVAGRSATLVGHSYGGTLVLAFAARHPELAASLLAYEPPLSWLEWWPTRGERSRPFGEMSGPEAAESFLVRMLGERYHRLPLRTREEAALDGDALVRELTALRADPPPFEPEEITPPALVARGENASSHQLRGTELLVARMPKAELRLIAGAGHDGHRSHPRQFAALVLEAVALAGTVESQA